MAEFHHVGVPTEIRHEGEVFVPDTKVWVTSPDDHPLKIEYLRYEADSEVTGPLRDSMHVAFTVDDLDAALEGQNVILGPFVPMEGLTVAFVQQESAVFEFMKYDA